MREFHFHLYSQILTLFDVVSHSISTPSWFCFYFYLITEYGLELYGVFSPSSQTNTQHIIPSTVCHQTLIFWAHVLSREGPLLVIDLYALQSLRFGTRRRIQSLTKHMRWNVFEKVAKGFQRLAIFTNC